MIVAPDYFYIFDVADAGADATTDFVVVAGAEEVAGLSVLDVAFVVVVVAEDVTG